MATDPKDGELAGQDELDLGEIEAVVEVKEPVETASAPEDDGIELLKKQLADLEAQSKQDRSAKEAAERLARERETEVSRVRNEANTAKVEVADSRLRTVGAAIDAVKRDAQIAKAEWADAMDRGDFARAADAQEMLTKSVARLDQLEVAKETLTNAVRQAQEHAKAQAAETDRFENYIAGFTPRQQSWLRQHPDYVTNDRLNKQLIATYYQAQADDIDPDSDEFFDMLNQRVSGAPKRQPASSQDDDDGVDVVVARPEKPQRQVAAPVSRQPTVTNAGRNSPGTVRLTREERELAQQFGMTDAEWAANKVQLQKEGAYVRH